MIINAEKIVLTGLKADQKLYRRYTGFPVASAKSPSSSCWSAEKKKKKKKKKKNPEAIVEQAVKGHASKSKMGRQMATKPKVYQGDKHPHHAQQPQPLEATV